MSLNSTQAYVDIYEQNLRHALQQHQSILSPTVSVGTMTGKKKRFTYIGAAEMDERTDKNGNTKWASQDFYSRWVSRRIFDRAVLIDEYDDVESALTDPTGDLVQSAIMAANRRKDNVIVEAVTASAWTGENATEEVKFSENNIIDIRTGGSNENVSLNLAKLKELAARMDDGDVAPENRYFIASTRQIHALLNDDHVTSADYNTVKALVSGTIDTFMGFKFIVFNRLPIVEGIRSCFAWQKECMQLAISTDIKVKGPVPIPEKHFQNGLEVTLACDAVRLYDAGVFQIPCAE